MSLRDDFRAFITGAETIGLPVNVLRVADQHYEFEVGDPPMTDPLLGSSFRTPRIQYPRNLYTFMPTVRVMMQPSHEDDVDSIYHEATHAWLNVMRRDQPRVATILRSAEVYYSGQQSFPEGRRRQRRTMSTPATFTVEAAAEYVGGRCSIYYNAYQTLSRLVHSTGPVRSAFRESAIRSAARSYFRDQRFDNLGYEFEGFIARVTHSGSTYRSDASIPSALQQLLDHEVLEDRIPRHFADVPAFQALIEPYQRTEFDRRFRPISRDQPPPVNPPVNLSIQRLVPLGGF
jgi:hypothetical protein